MRIEIIMPKMGESVTEGTIIKWHKKPGDTVKKDEILFEISTDKVDTEIPVQSDGILAEVLFNEGDTIEVGKTVAYIETDAAEVQIIAPVVETQKEVKAVPVNTTENTNPSGQESVTLIDIPMPKMGESVMEGTIIKWHKSIGDAVKKDETIFEISTDKVDTEVPSPAEGILFEILAQEQETVPVGTTCGKLQTAVAKDGYSEKLTETLAKSEPAAMHDVIAQNAARVIPQDIILKEVQPQEAVEGNSFFSPLVMNIAQKENVSQSELQSLKGTGIGGRVTKKDILAYLEFRKLAPAVKIEPEKPIIRRVQEVVLPKAQVTFETGIASAGVERIPMDNIRQKIMQHMIYSRDTSVHVTGLVEVDMGGIHNYLKEKKEILLKQEGIKLTYMSFIAHATVKALREFPLVNASIENMAILKKKSVNLGIAVALEPNGLIVPNIKNSHERNLFGLAKAIGEIAEKARTKKLTPDDISGGTFTITNYGVFGTLFGTPIINQPEVAILGVGAVVKRAVVVEINGSDAIVIKPMMYLTLSHDHRLVDGMLGGKFLKSIKDHLENFSEKELF
ncbi:MAG: 2-oxoglutarate dehydrogenase, E2 component, dihydrolipoamide succinyltransferase [Ignavibacteriales bacterium]|nr:2-oxoglutarate dehydrogenase, E2 component, dihydrolipoamide succinyltransferase [Ignavibacteriales bacterium]